MSGSVFRRFRCAPFLRVESRAGIERASALRHEAVAVERRALFARELFASFCAAAARCRVRVVAEVERVMLVRAAADEVEKEPAFDSAWRGDE